MGIYALAMSVGFMAAFPLVGAVVLSSGWRTAWAGIGAALLLVIAPVAWFLGRSRPEDVGQELDGDASSDASRSAAAAG